MSAAKEGEQVSHKGDEDAIVEQAQDSSFDENLPPSVNSGVRQVTDLLQERLHLLNREAIPVLVGVAPAPQLGGDEPAVAAPAEEPAIEPDSWLDS